MDASEAQKYREAADLVWDLAKKFTGHQVAEDLKTLSTELHAKASGHSKLPPKVI